MNKYTITACVLLLTLYSVYGFYHIKSEKICLAAGFSDYKVNVKLETYCIRGGINNEVVYMGRLK